MLWSLATASPLFSVAMPTRAAVRALACDAESGRVAASSAEGALTIWQLDDSQAVQLLEADAPADRLRFADGGAMLVGIGVDGMLNRDGRAGGHFAAGAQSRWKAFGIDRSVRCYGLGRIAAIVAAAQLRAVSYRRIGVGLAARSAGRGTPRRLPPPIEQPLKGGHPALATTAFSISPKQISSRRALIERKCEPGA